MMGNKKGDIEIYQIILMLIALFALVVLIMLSVGWGKQASQALGSFIKTIFS